MTSASAPSRCPLGDLHPHSLGATTGCRYSRGGRGPPTREVSDLRSVFRDAGRETPDTPGHLSVHAGSRLAGVFLDRTNTSPWSTYGQLVSIRGGTSCRDPRLSTWAQGRTHLPRGSCISEPQVSRLGWRKRTRTPHPQHLPLFTPRHPAHLLILYYIMLIIVFCVHFVSR